MQTYTSALIHSAYFIREASARWLRERTVVRARTGKPSPPGMCRSNENVNNLSYRTHAENSPVTFVSLDCSGGLVTVSHLCSTFCCANETRSSSNHAFSLIICFYALKLAFRHRRWEQRCSGNICLCLVFLSCGLTCVLLHRF